MESKGQVSIFVIVAIVIVAAILIFFAFRSGLFSQDVPAEFRPVYSAYSECLEQEASSGLEILGTQGGRIEFGEFTPGSEFAPFSSNLNFLGLSVPYWYYLTGNNIIRESVPSLSDMEQELADYIEQNINDCDLTQFYEQGFYVEFSEDIKADVRIEDNEVRVNLDSTVTVLREDRSATKSNHEIVTGSKLGKFYSQAVEIYNAQKQNAFLEAYTIDTLRLNAPVDGVSVQCSPEIWSASEVVSDLRSSLEANIGAIKLNGNYYSLDEQEDNYYVVDINTDESVNFVYSKSWPSKIEVIPAEGELMIAEPVGNQQGLGVMGFCYVPYHFVYDVSFPVMVQITDGFEIFQFPVVVIVDNNLPRQADLSYTPAEESPEVCSFNVGEAQIRTYDANLNPVEADVKYRCFDQVCNLGSTEVSGVDATLDADIPVCLNGELIANAEGYAEKKVIFSSNSEQFADIVLDREHKVDVELSVGGRALGDSLAVVYFVKDDGTSQTVVWPDRTKITLSEGSYNIEGFVYGDSSITIPASSRTECVDVARSGIIGLFGGTKEECFDINIPAVEIDQALVGGGSSDTYILESQLETGRVNIDLASLPRPTSLEQLQYNAQSFEELGVIVSFG